MDCAGITKHPPIDLPFFFFLLFFVFFFAVVVVADASIWGRESGEAEEHLGRVVRV
jgi:hypothetical protein